MPCTVCVATHAVAGATAAGEPLAGGPDGADAAKLAVGAVCYQQWGWPVTVLRDQVRLSLHRDVSALAVPIPLGVEVTRILTQVTGVLLLPPTVTPRGPITWIRPPRADSLRLCREIDLFAALRTALPDTPPGGDSAT